MSDRSDWKQWRKTDHVSQGMGFWNDRPSLAKLNYLRILGYRGPVPKSGTKASWLITRLKRQALKKSAIKMAV